ncbi:MAG: MvaI/BcnI restriction endonuclease family protein [Dehalococcoidia bacterium]|nr:MvaI/BcnI restriction endonuclease family protein [Dehalococcoidia bacterium]
MPLRRLTSAELRIATEIGATGAPVSYLHLTATGHAKSLMDATAPIRSLLKESGIHDYDEQAKGPSHKVLLPALCVSDRITQTKVSLYRPLTKGGDPRLWFYGLSDLAKPDNIIAVTITSRQLLAVNISALAQLSDIPQEVTALLSTLHREEPAAQELLQRLRSIAATGPLISVATGDTAIGRTLEAALGVQANSSKAPDYQGIELKSARSARPTRKTLFAQVPDWDISSIRSSAELLDRFGYWRDGMFKLNNTVTSLRPNSQGMQLRLDMENDLLAERTEHLGNYLYWRMTTLRTRLAEKHSETFWIEADDSWVDGVEHFQLTKVVHTRSPIVSSLEPLLATGLLTVDHLIKRVGSGVRERGPLFKTTSAGLASLFPPPLVYRLIQ